MKQSFHTTPLQIVYNKKCSMIGKCAFFLGEKNMNKLELCTEASFNITTLFLFLPRM